MAPAPGIKYCKVDVYASSVLKTPLEETWQHARDFGQASWWRKAGQGQFSVERLAGNAVTEIGCQRILSIGHARLFEQLSALDDLEHVMRWILVSHPQTLSPFGQASFLNYTSSLQLRPVTLSNQTFAEWNGSFYTERQHIPQMEALLLSWYYAGFQGLEIAASSVRQSPLLGIIPPHPAPIQPTSLPSNYSIPVQPPGTDQVAFNGPMETLPPTSNGASYDGMGSDERIAPHGRFANGAGIGTNSSSSSQARQASQNTSRGALLRHPVSKGPPTPTSPSSYMRMNAQGSSGRGPFSDPSSIESTGPAALPRRISDQEAQKMGAESQAVGIGTYGHAAPGYLPQLGSIEEGVQLRSAVRGHYPEGVHNVPEHLMNAGPAGVIPSASNSGSSQHSQHSHSSSQPSKARGVMRIKSPSLDGGQDKGHREYMQDLARRSQGSSVRPGSVSAMKNEALRAFNVDSKKRSPMRPIQPDWSSMKEVAYVDSQGDAEIMNNLADNVGNHQEKNERCSLEEEAASLQARHNKLHSKRPSTSEQPFMSPFSASPFGAQQAPVNSFVSAQPVIPANPFGAVQATALSPNEDLAE